jgi:hypothetical protein
VNPPMPNMGLMSFCLHLPGLHVIAAFIVMAFGTTINNPISLANSVARMIPQIGGWGELDVKHDDLLLIGSNIVCLKIIKFEFSYKKFVRK